MEEQYRITDRQLARLNELIELASKRPILTSPFLAEAASISAVVRSTQVLEWLKVTRDASSGRWEEEA